MFKIAEEHEEEHLKKQKTSKQEEKDGAEMQSGECTYLVVVRAAWHPQDT